MKKGIILGLFILLLSFSFSSAGAFDETIWPNEEGYKDTWLSYGCTGLLEYICVQEDPLHTTGIHTRHPLWVSSFRFNDLVSEDLNEDSFVTSVYVDFEGIVFGDGEGCVDFFLVESEVSYTNIGTNCYEDDWTNYSSNMAYRNPHTGTSWTFDDVENLEIAVQSRIVTDSTLVIDQIYAVVEWVTN
jgi:hypothetical protein